MNKTLKSIAFLFTAFSLSKIVGAVTSFAIPKILEPEGYGAWVTVLLIVSYSPIVALGTVEALLRQYPYYEGQGDKYNAHRVESAVLVSIVISSIMLVSIGLIIPTFVIYNNIDQYSDEIRLMFLAASVSLYSAFYFHRFAAHQSFKIYGIIDTVRAVLTLLFVCTSAWLWGIKGAVCGYLATELLLCATLVILSKKYCGPISIYFVLDEILDAIKIGFPITVVWWAMTLQTSVDRIISSIILGKAQTGYYGLGISIIGVMLLIPQSINRVLYPKINENIGQSMEQSKLAMLVIVPVKLLSVVVPLLSGMLVIVLPVIYAKIFPKYTPGILSAQILMMGFFFVAIVGNGVNYLIARNKQNILLRVIAFCIAVNILLSSILAYAGFGITGVAIGTSVSACAIASAVWYLVLRLLDYVIGDLIREICSLYYPFIISVILIVIISAVNKLYMQKSVAETTALLFSFVILYTAITSFIPPFNRMRRELLLYVKEKAFMNT